MPLRNAYQSELKLRIIFAGTPEFAAVALQSLIIAGHEICAVYCQPDRPSGRGKKLLAGAVKQLAIEHQIPVEQPLNFKSETALAALQSYHADLMIVVAYGLLLPPSVLHTPKYGCINIHGSLLPRWRGAAPIHRSIESGDQETGITIMQMDVGLDTGPMLLKMSCSIEPQETGSTLHDKLAILGGSAINRYLQDFNAEYKGEIQNNEMACYAHKLSKQEAEVDWSQSGAVIERKIRAFNAWPVAFTYVGDKRLRIWQASLTDQATNLTAGSIVSLTKLGVEVACGDHASVLITELQPDGSKVMTAESLLNSRKEWFEKNPKLGSNV